mgnify:CR=1 FL=1
MRASAKPVSLRCILVASHRQISLGTEARILNQTKLISTENFYASLDLNPLPQVLLKADSPQFTICYVNNALLDLYVMHRLKREDIVGKSFTEFFSQGTSAKSTEEMLEVLNQVIDKKEEVTFPGTTESMWEVKCSPILNEKHVVTHVIRTIVNTKSVEEHQFQTIIENLTDGIFSSHPNGNILSVNEATTRLTGYSKEELLTMNLVDFVSESSLKERPIDFNLVKFDASVTLERGINRKNGEERRIRMNATRLRNGSIVSVFRDITDEKNKEMALQRSEYILKATLETVPSCVKLVSKNLDLIEINKAGLKQIETTNRKDVIGKSILGLVMPGYKSDYKKLYINAYEGQSGKLIFQLKGMKGGIKWMETHALPFKNEQSGERCVLGVTRDITEQKLAADQLRESNERFESAVEATNDGIWDWDAATDKTWANERLLQLYGPNQDPDKINKEVFFNRIHPNDRARVFKLFENGLTLQHPKLMSEYRFKTGSGEYRDIFDRSLVTYNEDGSPKRILGAMQDITNRKLAERRLQASDEKYRYLFNSNPQPMFIYSFDTHKILDCNEQTLLNYGYLREEFIGMSVLDIRPSEDRKKMEEALTQDINIGGRNQSVWRHCKKTGEIMNVEITNHVIEYLGEKSALVLINDITEKLKTREELIKTNEQLKRSNEIAKLGYFEMIEGEDNSTWSNEMYSILGYNLNDKKLGTRPRTSLFFDHVHPEDLELVSHRFYEIKQTQKTLFSDFRIIANDGHLKHLSTTTYVTLNSDGKNVFTGTIQDISERKLQLETIEKQNLHFEEIAYLQSHVVRAPLARILGIIQLIKQSQLNGDEVPLMLENAMDSALELDSVIRQISNKTKPKANA